MATREIFDVLDSVFPEGYSAYVTNKADDDSSFVAATSACGKKGAVLSYTLNDGMHNIVCVAGPSERLVRPLGKQDFLGLLGAIKDGGDPCTFKSSYPVAAEQDRPQRNRRAPDRFAP